MNTNKTPHQVGKVKQRILAQYPNWRETFSYLNQATNNLIEDNSYSEGTSSDESSEAPSSPLEPTAISEDIAMIILEEGIAGQAE